MWNTHSHTHIYICLLYFAQKSTTNREWTDVNKREYPKKNQNLYPAEVCIIFTTFYLRISLNPISRKKHLTEKSICQVKMPTFFLPVSRPFSSHVPTHSRSLYHPLSSHFIIIIVSFPFVHCMDLYIPVSDIESPMWIWYSFTLFPSSVSNLTK